MANESYGSIIHNGVNYSLGTGENSANKTDISSIILTGTTNTSGGTITAGTWFYLNGEVCRAKTDIAANATFTLNTNYEKKSVGSALSELNSNLGGNPHYYSGTSTTSFSAIAAASGGKIPSWVGGYLDNFSPSSTGVTLDNDYGALCVTGYLNAGGNHGYGGSIMNAISAGQGYFVWSKYFNDGTMTITRLD